MITVKRAKNDRGVSLGSLNVGDTFLYDNRVGIIVVRNGHCFPLDLENAIEMQSRENYPFPKILPLDTKVVPIQVELTYKIL